MVRKGATHIKVAAQETNGGADFRFGSRERASALLFALRHPNVGKVTVEVETLGGRSEFDLHAVVPAHTPLGVDAVIGAAIFIGATAAHQAGIFRAHLPRAIGIFDPHIHNQAVAVNIFWEKAVTLVGVRVAAGA